MATWKDPRIITAIKSMNFNQKISLFLVSTILTITITITVITSVSAGITIKSKSSEIAMRHIESIANNLEVTLKEFNDIAILLISDSRILKYARATKETDQDYIQLGNDAYDAMVYIKNTKTIIDYIFLIKYNDNSIKYFGNQWTNIDLFNEIEKNYKAAMSTGYGNMKVGLSRKIFGKDGYDLNIYQPIHDPYELKKRIALVCFTIDADVLTKFYEVHDAKMPFDTYITDANGRIISHKDADKIFSFSNYRKNLKGKKGSFQKDGKLITYNYIEDWNWYIVGVLPTSYLLSDTHKTILTMLIIMIVLCIISIKISFSLSNSLYRPLSEMVKRMSSISKGDLSTRMKGEYSGRDFKMMVNGFNHMAEQFEILLQRVKEEQEEIKRIELNALQSQIKPHFLYNTLECIHWQALSDGNREVSTMVKALANFYRLCLSKGRDIIPLSNEIAHVENYLIIQNMRYGNIIERDFDIDPKFENVLIPKMTLQPLVENSIYHGIKVKDGYKGKISIRAYQEGEDIIITVSDNGAGMDQEKIDEINNSLSRHDESFGYGIRNVHKRIEILYGDGYGLFYKGNDTGGITVEIRLKHNKDKEIGGM